MSSINRNSKSSLRRRRKTVSKRNLSKGKNSLEKKENFSNSKKDFFSQISPDMLKLVLSFLDIFKIPNLITNKIFKKLIISMPLDLSEILRPITRLRQVIQKKYNIIGLSTWNTETDKE